MDRCAAVRVSSVKTDDDGAVSDGSELSLVNTSGMIMLLSGLKRWAVDVVRSVPVIVLSAARVRAATMLSPVMRAAVSAAFVVFFDFVAKKCVAGLVTKRGGVE